MRLIAVEILGVNLKADLLNPKIARKFDNGLKKVAEISKKATESGSGPDWIEKDCNAVIDFLDNIFGAGSAKKVLGEETDLLTCLDAFEEIVKLYDNQINPILTARANALQTKAGNVSGDA